MFKKLLNKIREITPKQMAVAGVFTLALATSIGLGLATKQFASGAGAIRDDDQVNSIDGCPNNGGIGAADRVELIKDVRDAAAGKCVTTKGGTYNYTDLPGIYANYGLKAADYDKFAAEAQDGWIFRDGHVEVAGQTVMDNALTMGRTTMGLPSSVRKPVVINGKTYYQSKPDVSFADHVQKLAVMVWFDNDGNVITIIMNACGNQVDGHKRSPSAVCKALNKVDVAGKKNTFKFNTNVELDQYGLAKVTKVEYYIDGKLWTTKTNPSDLTEEYTFTKSADVSVKVYVSLPGGKSKVIDGVKVVDCNKHIEVFYTCDQLIATARDDTNRKFRFTVKARKSDGVTLKSADFSVDGTLKNAGVTTKDTEGRIYQDYDFDDNVTHTIVAKVNFDIDGQAFSKDCQAKVTPTKKPMCTVPGKEQYPPEAPECKEKPKECKPGVPIGSAECAPLPKTGPGSLAGLFAGASIAGTAAHRIFTRFRGRRDEE